MALIKTGNHQLNEMKMSERALGNKNDALFLICELFTICKTVWWNSESFSPKHE